MSRVLLHGLLCHLLPRRLVLFSQSGFKSMPAGPDALELCVFSSADRKGQQFILRNTERFFPFVSLLNSPGGGVFIRCTQINYLSSTEIICVN